jgi:copper chaperone CopZ
MSDRRDVTLKVVGDRTIHCGGCENTIVVSISKIPGVEQVEADRDSQLIQFELQPGEAQLALVTAELETLGYQVELT